MSRNLIKIEADDDSPLDAPGRAIMQYDDNQAYLAGRDVIVLQPGQVPAQFFFEGEQLIPSPRDEGLARRALAHALMASFLYREGRYDLPQTPGAVGGR